ncbi:Organic solvent tolerance protein OstA [Chlamydiifrater volucris]|uniref:CT351 family outer membrane beta-barrel protein n=1 Tax=Chlamydiifrater volucris TaxID=2681470 RepID=UPI001FECD07C|nr:Organic solvent tolerance protein OstA [Chlamydiifrater volucris]
MKSHFFKTPFKISSYVAAVCVTSLPFHSLLADVPQSPTSGSPKEASKPKIPSQEEDYKANSSRISRENSPIQPVFIEDSKGSLIHTFSPTPTVNRKNHYLRHFQGLSGTLDIEDGAISVRKDLRIQANRIYIKQSDTENCKLVAHGNVMVTYKAKTLTCDYFEYDETTDICLLTNGKFALYPWFVGGSTITLTPDALLISKGYISTSEGPQKDVVLSGDQIEFNSENVLSVGPTTFKIKGIPLLAFPTFSFMPLEIPKPPINFRGGTGGFLGSYLGISYSPINHKDIASTFFLDSFFKHGVGVGCNLRYRPKDTLSTDFVDIKSYYAHRIAIDMAEAHDRYRVNGDFSFTKASGIFKGSCHIADSWETVSDIFPKDFDLKNTGPTEASYSWDTPLLTGFVRTNFKANNFLSVNKELPLLFVKQKPMRIFHTPWFIEGILETGYSSFSFSDNIPNAKGFSAFKTNLQTTTYAAFPVHYGIITPKVETSITCCSKNNKAPQEKKYFGGGSMEVDYRLTAAKNFLSFKHIVEPFITLSGWGKPISLNKNHDIFSVADAFHSIALLSSGLSTTLIPKKNSLVPAINGSLRILAILNNCPGRPMFPKIEGKLSLPTGRYSKIRFDSEWIVKKQCWDHFNVTWQWTPSENYALSTEFFHRSKYSWKKCSKDNYILDVSRSEEELLKSPLSDQRNTFLAKVFIRPHPCWNLKFSLRGGWLRKNSPDYLEYQAILGTKIFEHWQLYSVYEHREADTRCYFFLKLDQAPKGSKNRINPWN